MAVTSSNLTAIVKLILIKAIILIDSFVLRLSWSISLETRSWSNFYSHLDGVPQKYYEHR